MIRDFYITKYHAKPMAQLQSLFTNIAVGLRRLEAEEEADQAGAEQPANLPEERARRTTLKIANAANRSSWCSCCENMATARWGRRVNAFCHAGDSARGLGASVFLNQYTIDIFGCEMCLKCAYMGRAEAG